MLEKSKIKQILLDKSLGQILKVDRRIESIQQDENIIPIKQFSQHFHTTAGREFVSIPCLKTKIDQNSDQNWKFIRPRTPSISFNCKPRITIFDEKKDISQQQGLNISISWEPIQKPIPLNKQTKRKPWFTLQVLHDSVGDHQKPKSICFVNYMKAIQNKERPKYDHQIDDSKVAQTYLKLKYYKKYFFIFLMKLLIFYFQIQSQNIIFQLINQILMQFYEQLTITLVILVIFQNNILIIIQVNKRIKMKLQYLIIKKDRITKEDRLILLNWQTEIMHLLASINFDMTAEISMRFVYSIIYQFQYFTSIIQSLKQYLNQSYLGILIIYN